MGIERLAALVLCLLLSFGARAEVASWNAAVGDAARGEDLDVALVTIGPGDIYWTRFGHNAIVVTDRASGEATFYNYGIFDFAQENFFLNFIRGRMQYLAVAEPFDRALIQYRREGRAITLQRLNLSPAQRFELKRFLDWNVQPENAPYYYDYYLNNCSTKVRDALDAVLGGSIRRTLGGRSRGVTFRMHTQRLTSPEPWLYLGTHLGLSGYTDRPTSYWEESFLPVEFATRVDDVQITDDAGRAMSVVSETVKLADAKIAQPASEPPRWRAWFLLTGLSLAGAIVVLARSSRGPSRAALGALLATVWIVCGVAGVGLATLWFATAHEAAHANENLFAFSPIAWLAIPAAWTLARGRMPSRFTRTVVALIAIPALVGLAVKVLPGFRQDNLDWLLLMIPVHLAAWYAVRQRD